MVEASQASKTAPVGIHPQAFSVAQKSVHGLAIHPKKRKIAAQIATSAKPINRAQKECRSKRWR
jgi:hypothetical protein